jgi:hypothetical protein
MSADPRAPEYKEADERTAGEPVVPAVRARAGVTGNHVRFSNRPFGVKRFQTIRRCSVDVAHGLALLFGIGTKALPLWDSRMRWSNLCSGLAVRRNGRSKRTCELTSSIVPRGTSFHRAVELRVSFYWI